MLQMTIPHPHLLVRKTSLVVLINMIEFDVSIVRTYLMEQKTEGNLLLGIITTQLQVEPDFITKSLLYEILKGSIDSFHIGPEEPTLTNLVDINAKTEEEKVQLVTIFYQEFAYNLYEPLFLEPPTEHTPSEVFLKTSLCDLLAIFVEHFPHASKLFIIKNNILPKIFMLLKCKEKTIVLGPIRILRKVIASVNKHYHTYIIENNLFQPIVELLLANGDKYNALNSAILELFQYIGYPKNNCKSLVKYFIENFYEKVKHINYVQTFKNLYILFENPEFTLPAEEHKFVGDAIREKNRAKFREEAKEESWFDTDIDSLPDGFEMNIDNSYFGEKQEKRKYDEINDYSNVPKLKRTKF